LWGKEAGDFGGIEKGKRDRRLPNVAMRYEREAGALKVFFLPREAKG